MSSASTSAKISRIGSSIHQDTLLRRLRRRRLRPGVSGMPPVPVSSPPPWASPATVLGPSADEVMPATPAVSPKPPGGLPAGPLTVLPAGPLAGLPAGPLAGLPVGPLACAPSAGLAGEKSAVDAAGAVTPSPDTGSKC